MKIKGGLLNILGWVIGLAVLGIIFWKLFEERELLFQAFTLSSLGWLTASFLLYLLTSLSYTLIWHLVAKAFGAREPFIQTLSTLSLVSITRYLPGAVWPFLGLLWLSNKIGLARRSIVPLTLVTQGLHLSLALWVSCLGLIFAIFENSSGLAVLLGLFSTLLILLIMAGFLRYFSPLLKKYNLTSGASLTSTLSMAGLTSLLVWGLNGLRLMLLLYAFNFTSSDWLFILFYCIWASALTSIASNLLFFLPLGLGAVELSLLTLLSLVLPGATDRLLVVALNRIIQVINDLLFAVFAISREVWQKKAEARQLER